MHRLIGQAGLDHFGAPAGRHNRRAHPDPECAGALQVRDHRVEPGSQIVASRIQCRPVQHRALREVSKVALDLGKLAIKHQARAEDLRSVEPADRLGPPFALDLTPGRSLQEAHRTNWARRVRQGMQERQVLLCGDSAYDQGPGHGSTLSHVGRGLAGHCRSARAGHGAIPGPLTEPFTGRG